MSLFRVNIEEMEGYVPGEQLAGGFLKLNTNENPYPPSPGVVEALQGVGEELRLYPAPFADVLREKAAQVYGLAPENIMAGNGSDDLLTIAVRAFVGEGEPMAYPWPSYVLYPTLAAIQNASAVPVPFPEDFSLPGGLAEANARLTIVCNPNSPTGTFVPVDEISRLALSVSGVVLVDEAYVDFADDSCVSLVAEHPNVVVTRSFSKSFSLAGVRIALAMASPDLISGMMKVKDSYNVSRLCIAAGVAALNDIDHMRANVEKIRRERTHLSAELENRGFSVLPSSANFLLARLAEGSAEALYLALKGQNILVRTFDMEGLSDCVRITIGTPEQDARLLEAIDNIHS